MQEELQFIGTTVLSTRIRLARNVQGVPFPSKQSDKEARDVVKAVRSALIELDPFTEYKMQEIDDTLKTKLLEQHLVSPLLLKQKNGVAFVSKDERVSVLVNEEDHLREQYILRGFDLYKAYERLGGLDEEIEDKVPFAYDEKLGYLTACPSNVGTGMRASVMMFLPGLTYTDKIKSLYAEFKKNGITVRGGFGEGTSANGYLYQISNERTLGYSEAEILSHMEEIALNLIELEIRSRETMLKREYLKYKDLCLRSYGLLCNCAKLTAKELEEEAVKIRLGVALGFLNVESLDDFNDFLDDMQPVSFRLKFSSDDDEKALERVRAEKVGEFMASIVGRNF